MNSGSYCKQARSMLQLYGLMTFVVVAAMSSSSSSSLPRTPVQLQSPHPILTPAERLQHLAANCHSLGIEKWDVYGDFDQSEAASFLRRFESEIAQEFHKDDAVFMPSGGMAQSITLLIHASRNQDKKKGMFICHATSHLLLHEQEAYSALCGIEALALGRTGFRQPPLSWIQVQECLESNSANVATIFLELPHRELGGKLTPWEEILGMRQLANLNGIAFHCDGARIFEATTGYEKSLAELAEPFDSMYISFYKGLGGMSGAMLLGSSEFCQEARVWLRRFGGNLYTLLPYAVAGWSGYRRYWTEANQQSANGDQEELMTFQAKKDKLVRLVESVRLSDEPISKVLTFEPEIPQVNMVHCYLRTTVAESEEIRDRILKETGISIFHRLRPIDREEDAFDMGYRSRFELSIGEANGAVPDDQWLLAWQKFGIEATLFITK